MDSANLLIWIHVLAMSAYFGAQFAVIYMLLPVAEQAGDESQRRAALITGFKFYNPFTIAMLGVVVGLVSNRPLHARPGQRGLAPQLDR